MSCAVCAGKNKNAVRFSCTCDSFVHPEPLSIAEGLDYLPRQIAGFPEFRRAMLHGIRTVVLKVLDENNLMLEVRPLEYWRARKKEDLGMMLLDMWAYICDSLSFYDQVIAQETYLRTGLQRPSTRKLVALLGYLPRPAVGSTAFLAAMAEGRIKINLPAGTAFESGAFNGNAPQVFELETGKAIHPLLNRFLLKTPVQQLLKAGTVLKSLLVKLQGEIREDMFLLLADRNNAENNVVVVVQQIAVHLGSDQQKYQEVFFTRAITIQKNTRLDQLRLMQPSNSVNTWENPGTLIRKKAVTLQYAGGIKYAGSSILTLNGINAAIYFGTTITLNSQVNGIKEGELIIAKKSDDLKWFRITAVENVQRQQVPGGKIKINGNAFDMPGVSTTVTEITTDVSLNNNKRGTGKWPADGPSGLEIYYGLQTVATVVQEADTLVSAAGPLLLEGFVETPIPGFAPTEFLLQDKNGNGAEVSGMIDFRQRQLKLSQGAGWSPDLVAPASVFGNVLTVTRGQSVYNELLGTGNASAIHQQFKLKKKPLTYFTSATSGNDQLVKNTLSIRVNGILWKEVNGFYGKGEGDQVYTVRQDDAGDSWISFGDGIRGQRLPSGADVVANYRFGAEGAMPPAAAINQISKPAKGLQSVKNPMDAFGGDDAEPTENLKVYAPKSALLLGRVVSMKDMEALAAGFPGVRAVKGEWRWDLHCQRATAQLIYIGDGQLATGLTKAVRNMADPATPISIVTAIPKALRLSLSIKTDPRYPETDVLVMVRAALLNSKTGLLAAERIGIAQPLYRSQVFDAVLAVEGAVSVSGIFINGRPFNRFAVVPGPASYFSIENGKLLLNGKDE
ncbi:hypothetical protein [Flavihumibacter fluvii]|uniref:hypothetical protein n=1 Tax=Flavihumibacter fluvii TaxID=2838157 RepID=UPI001BDF0271|nr:hypothetical protein [Flavihumibacter fluvii]ULQ53242.1 hypothetical protein KJS93_02795 [Flavihumibacter fluvii]